MDLLGAIGAARQIRDVARRTLSGEPDWARDEEAFFRHFGVPYEAYAEIVEHLQPEQQDLLEATLEVNPEAAVLWILAMQEVEV